MHKPPSKPPAIPDSLAQKRRNFLKRSAALPVVLTLSNGSAFAAVSISCLAKMADPNKAPNPMPATVVTSPDGWNRYETRCRNLDGIGLVYEFPKDSDHWFPENTRSTNPDFYKTVSQSPNLMAQDNVQGGSQYSFNTTESCYVLAMLYPDPAPSGKLPGTPIDPPVAGPYVSNQDYTAAANTCLQSFFN
jgi:hypothetical protein